MKTIGILILIAVLAAGSATAAAARGPGQAGRPHKKSMCTGMWLERTAGTTTSVAEIEDGVEVLITSTDPVTAAKLQTDAPDYYAKKKDTDCGCCAAALTGASTVVENINNGVKVTITAKEPALAGKIKAAGCAMGRPKAAKKSAPVKTMKKTVKWVCPMGEYESDKPGKCPKCGMTLVRKK
ncbi:MAG: heavy metal-binding domain-containing protein [Elusimicrobiales bacterium]